jgi:glutamine synthetase
MLACGLDGVDRGLALPAPVEEDLYHLSEEDLVRRSIGTLPGTLGEAVQELQKDEVVREALGEHIYSHLVEAQQQEWNEFRIHVTDWERERYLEIY